MIDPISELTDYSGMLSEARRHFSVFGGVQNYLGRNCGPSLPSCGESCFAVSSPLTAVSCLFLKRE